MNPLPVYLYFDGESFVPLKRFRARIDKEFVVGMTYPMVVDEPRSHASHNHFFASVEEGWRNLPENIAEHFPTPEHLRKYALIKAGYADQRSFVCSSRTEAVNLAAFIRPMDGYAIVSVAGQVVRVFTAQSQSKKAMGGKVFQQSKQACLDIIAAMIGVDTHALEMQAAGQTMQTAG
jgi:hypothetical protein